MPTTTDTKPPRTGAGEKATLLGFLNHLRDAIATEAEGVPEPQVRAAGVPSGASLLGLVKHLACQYRKPIARSRCPVLVAGAVAGAGAVPGAVEDRLGDRRW
jgi:hypothetical protein